MVNIANSIDILNDGLLSLFNIDNENTKISNKKSNIKLNESLNEKLSEEEYGKKVQNGEIIEKYIDLTEPYVQYTIDSYLDNGWKIKHEGTTLMILYKDITTDNFYRNNIKEESLEEDYAPEYAIWVFNEDDNEWQLYSGSNYAEVDDTFLDRINHPKYRNPIFNVVNHYTDVVVRRNDGSVPDDGRPVKQYKSFACKESFDDEYEKSMKFATDEEAYEWAEENGFQVLKIQDCQDGCLAFLKKQDESLNESPTDKEREVFKTWYDEYMDALRNRQDIMIAPYCGYSYIEENGTYYDIENDRFISPEEVEKILYQDYIEAIQDESFKTDKRKLTIESLEPGEYDFDSSVFDFKDGPLYFTVKGNWLIVCRETSDGVLPEYRVELDGTDTVNDIIEELKEIFSNEDSDDSEEDVNESLDTLKQEFKNMTKLPVFDFADGPMYVDIQGDKMVAGTATNNGIIPEYEIELDETETLDANLNRLYDVIVEEHPEYLEECLVESYEDTIEQELKNPTQNFTKKSGTITCQDEMIKNIVYEVLKRYYKIVKVSDCQEDAKGECNFVISYDGLRMQESLLCEDEEQTKSTISQEEAEKALNSQKKKAEKLLYEPDKLEQVLQAFERSFKDMPVPIVGTAASYVPAMISLVRSYITGKYKNVPSSTIVAIIAAIIYYIVPKDIIADKIPKIGKIDDMAVITLCMDLCGKDVEKYNRWRQKHGMVAKDE